MAPQQWAFDQLQSLIDEQLVERGLVLEFYFRLSMIVRRYIDQRFDLTAPERTTEEFMQEAQRTLKLPEGYRTTAYSLLQAYDMVKFARHEPAFTEYERLRADFLYFIDLTREVAEEPSVGPSRAALEEGEP